MTDQERANKARELLEHAKDALAGLDPDRDPILLDLQDEIQSIMDDIELELDFDMDGSLEPTDEDDFDDGDPFDEEDDDDEDDEDDEEDEV